MSSDLYQYLLPFTTAARPRQGLALFLDETDTRNEITRGLEQSRAGGGEPEPQIVDPLILLREQKILLPVQELRIGPALIQLRTVAGGEIDRTQKHGPIYVSPVMRAASGLVNQALGRGLEAVPAVGLVLGLQQAQIERGPALAALDELEQMAVSIGTKVAEHLQGQEYSPAWLWSVVESLGQDWAQARERQRFEAEIHYDRHHAGYRSR